MSLPTFAALSESMDQLIAELEAALEACRRRSRAQSDMIGDRIPDYTDPDWVVSVPGSGHGGLGGGVPLPGGGGFADQHPLNPRPGDGGGDE